MYYMQVYITLYVISNKITTNMKLRILKKHMKPDDNVSLLTESTQMVADKDYRCS